MAPTTDEELKLRLFAGDISQLGPAERFLKSMVAVPFAFKRMESLLLMSSLQEEVSSIKESFTTLEVKCKILIFLQFDGCFQSEKYLGCCALASGFIC